MTIPSPIIPEAPMANAIDDVKIENCPFCGGNGDTFFKAAPHSKTGFWWNVVCNDHCLAEGPMHGTEAEAVAAWNRRASPVPSQHTGWSDEAVEAANRQCDNMAFVINNIGMPDAWLKKFMAELGQDRATLAASSISPSVAKESGDS